MMILFFILQDSLGVLQEIAKQGTAILVLFLILVFVVILTTRVLPTWERVKTADSNSQIAVAKSLGEVAASQSQMASVLKEVVVDLRQSTDQVKILQRVNAQSNETLAHSVEEINDRLDKLEHKI